MKKQYFKLGVIATMVLALTACSKNKEDKSMSDDNLTTPTVTEEVNQEDKTITGEKDDLDVTIIPLDEFLNVQDSRETPVLDEDTGRIHFQGFIYELKEEEAAIVDYDWIDTEEITLPSSLTYEEKEYPVTSVGEEAFFYCSEIKKLTIPGSIKTIGVNAFYGCDELAEVVLQQGVTKIDNAAFYGCTSLTDITLPDGLLYIGSEAFCSCSELAAITIPDSVKEIGSEAFYECTSMESITLPASLTSLSEGLFSGCENLSQINLPEGLTMIGNEAFWYCSGLTQIELPENLVHIGERAFYSAGVTELTLPASVTGVTEETLDGCDTIKKLYVSEADLEHYKELFGDTEIEVLAAKKAEK